ncbi:glyoxylate reductase/hydroxypyruvate reductase-like [Anopheles ziemanni]|uniref:glyoxylate reductase/hydroxypyruvate reductase-like n=1 Tax=Anopheles coustani TaxID=139045 RepID=UPI00265A94C8|nr:glyoxylate reductase/hydroxypyruvate reductase-like [Anopheles coustani]XP_058166409.1 glyoxylate reductase/hydroxypyruvate reductase-like [Anopheles ziemanni]
MRTGILRLTRSLPKMLEQKLVDYNFGVRRPKLVVTSSDIPSGFIELLRKKCEVTVCNGTDHAEILRAVPGAEGILWLTADQLDAKTLDAAGSQLKVVSTMTSGMDYVDAEVFAKRGVALGHTPKVVNDPVADIAIGLMLAAARRFHEGREKIVAGQWEMRPQWMLGQDVPGSTVGIIGFGGIGQTILKRLKGFDIARCLYTGRKRKAEGDLAGATYVDLPTLLKESDFVFIACPLTGETAKLFNRETLAMMKASSVLVNVARGGIVDQPALVEALKNGTIFAAGLDVMTPEPLDPNDPLMKLPNCVVVPHLGTATKQSLLDMFAITANNVLSVISGGQLVAPFVK